MVTPLLVIDVEEVNRVLKYWGWSGLSKKKYIGVEVINTIEPALMGTPQKEPRNIYKETKKCKMGNRQKENRWWARLGYIGFGCFDFEVGMKRGKHKLCENVYYRNTNYITSWLQTKKRDSDRFSLVLSQSFSHVLNLLNFQLHCTVYFT